MSIFCLFVIVRVIVIVIVIVLFFLFPFFLAQDFGLWPKTLAQDWRVVCIAHCASCTKRAARITVHIFAALPHYLLRAVHTPIACLTGQAANQAGCGRMWSRNRPIVERAAIPAKKGRWESPAWARLQELATFGIGRPMLKAPHGLRISGRAPGVFPVLAVQSAESVPSLRLTDPCPC